MSFDSRSGPVVELKGVYKHFPDFFLADINLDLYPGEAHVIVGENGSGKSSVMKLLSGWFPPDSGTVLFRGQPLKIKSIHDGPAEGVLYIHQDVQCFDNLSVAENVFFYSLPRLLNVPFLFDRNRTLYKCGKVFSDLGVSLDPATPMGRLGYAERQLVVAVRAYVTASPVVILDEPTSAMTEPDREILFEIVARLKEDGRGIFYISHRMDEIRQIGDRVSVMQRGHIVGTRACEGIDRESIVQMMVGDVEKKGYPRFRSTKGPILMEVKGISSPPILRDVTFNVRRREILGITGLMGSGRTLLAHCLFGMTRPAGGTITIDGRDVAIGHPVEAMNAGISLVPEDRADNGLFPRHNLVHNSTIATLKRFRHLVALDGKYMWEMTHDFARSLDVKPGHPNDVVGRYSGGNQQKVLVSRWLMNRSKIYIMDEPTRGIDVASKVDIYNAMNDLVHKGASIILISSEIEEILGMCDRILVLAGGRITAEMDRTTATRERILASATDDS